MRASGVDTMHAMITTQSKIDKKMLGYSMPYLSHPGRARRRAVAGMHLLHLSHLVIKDTGIIYPRKPITVYSRYGEPVPISKNSVILEIFKEELNKIV